MPESIKFPDMFNSNSTKVVKGLAATKSNTLLLLHSEATELFGDPYFGVRIKRYLFDQNNYILKDILIDEIYTKIAVFLPQIKLNRKDIKIIQDRAKLYCNFKATNMIDFTTNTYSLVLYDGETIG